VFRQEADYASVRSQSLRAVGSRKINCEKVSEFKRLVLINLISSPITIAPLY